MKKLGIISIVWLLLIGCTAPPSEPGTVTGVTTELTEAVEIVVQVEPTANERNWALSWTGDKLAYHIDPSKTEVLLLETMQTLELRQGCRHFFFPDDNFIGCGSGSVEIRSKNGDTISASMASHFIEIKEDNSLTEISRTIIRADDATDLSQILDTAQQIYGYTDGPRFLMILLALQPNEDQTIKQIDIIHHLADEAFEEIRERYADILIERSWWRTDYRGAEVVSPDGAYYFILDESGQSLTIHTVEDDSALITFSIKEGSEFRAYRIRLGGWTADSSGVIFQTAPSGATIGYTGTPFGHIRKLKVPQ